MPFVFDQPVLFQHCDPAGIVYYPRYFDMLTAAMEAWFAECAGVDFAALHDRMGLATPTAALKAEFVAPSRHGDRLALTLTALRLGRTSLTLAAAFACGDEARLTATWTVVLTSRAGAPTPWPADVARRIEDAMAEYAQ